MNKVTVLWVAVAVGLFGAAVPGYAEGQGPVAVQNPEVIPGMTLEENENAAGTEHQTLQGMQAQAAAMYRSRRKTGLAVILKEPIPFGGVARRKEPIPFGGVARRKEPIPFGGDVREWLNSAIARLVKEREMANLDFQELQGAGCEGGAERERLEQMIVQANRAGKSDVGLAELRAELESVANRLAKEDASAQGIREDIEELLSEREEFRDQEQALRNEIAGLNAALNSYNARLAHAARQQRAAEAELARLTKAGCDGQPTGSPEEIEAARARVQEIRQTRVEITIAMRRTRKQLSRARQAYDRTVSRWVAVEMELVRKQSLLASANGRRKWLEGRAENLSRWIQGAEASGARAVPVERLRDRLAYVGDRLGFFERMRSIAVKKIKQIEAKIKALTHGGEAQVVLLGRDGMVIPYKPPRRLIF